MLPALLAATLAAAGSHADGNPGAPADRRALPLLADQPAFAGNNLPKPFGISLLYTWIEQDMRLDSLEFSTASGRSGQFDTVRFRQSEARNKSPQLKLDAWLLPFMQLFAVVGNADIKSRVDTEIQGSDLLTLAGVGALCGPGPSPPACDATFSFSPRRHFSGTNYGIGTQLGYRWGRTFAGMNISYFYTDLDEDSSDIKTLKLTPRIGSQVASGRWGKLDLYTGANYLDIDMTLESRFSRTIAGLPGNGTVSGDFRIKQRNDDRWSFLLGSRWAINRSVQLTLETGYRGSINSAIGGISYRY